jgi:hypothetical protein
MLRSYTEINVVFVSFLCFSYNSYLNLYDLSPVGTSVLERISRVLLTLKSKTGDSSSSRNRHFNGSKIPVGPVFEVYRFYQSLIWCHLVNKNGTVMCDTGYDFQKGRVPVRDYLQSSKKDFLKFCFISFEESVISMMIEFLTAEVDSNTNSHVRLLWPHC